ncbi:uncharacterized protein MELLADRAFT_109931 [Melampsora larici-populina 98AG31]|uniref:Uncharacterized protein n=1 Tax=Melampsora larici-populina (strain 98AG31 / pathotype 3-4-7) TaxID=747676 RepID=F4RY36_MELLP|nr:uncharacterized protein MELLADRAFT_109931 [Melampsora larici-populina 98AG31]EGG02709.1 hypothetical protein MELLADRAFT_109931 [Melampsora larici-populina 98AG31]
MYFEPSFAAPLTQTGFLNRYDTMHWFRPNRGKPGSEWLDRCEDLILPIQKIPHQVHTLASLKKSPSFFVILPTNHNMSESSQASESKTISTRPIRTRRPVINPSMVSPMPDSRRQLSLDQPVTLKTKRKDPSYNRNDEDADSDGSIMSSHPDGQKRKNNRKTPSNSSQSKSQPKRKKKVISDVELDDDEVTISITFHSFQHVYLTYSLTV